VNASTACPSCNYEMSVPVTMLGKSVRCAQCRSMYVAGDAEDQSPLVAQSAAVEDRDDDRRFYRRPPPPPPRPSIFRTFLMIRLIIYAAILAVVVFGFLGLVALGVLIMAFSKPQGPVPPSNWQTLSPKDGRFTVLMPEEWQETHTMHDESHRFKAILKDRNIAFEVEYSEAGIERKNERPYMKAYREIVLRENPGGKVVSEQWIGAITGQEGLDFAISTKDNKIHKRIFVDKGRVFVLTVSGDRIDSYAQDVDKFFDSFEISD
jgi:hypothetical protein